MANYDVESHTHTNTHTHTYLDLVQNIICFFSKFLAPYARTTRYEEAFFPLENQGRKARFAREPHDNHLVYNTHLSATDSVRTCLLVRSFDAVCRSKLIVSYCCVLM